MMEENVYYTYVGEHSQRQESPGESPVAVSRLSYAMGEREEPGLATKRYKEKS